MTRTPSVSTDRLGRHAAVVAAAAVVVLLASVVAAAAVVRPERQKGSVATVPPAVRAAAPVPDVAVPDHAVAAPAGAGANDEVPPVPDATLPPGLAPALPEFPALPALPPNLPPLPCPPQLMRNGRCVMPGP